MFKVTRHTDSAKTKKVLEVCQTLFPHEGVGSENETSVTLLWCKARSQCAVMIVEVFATYMYTHVVRKSMKNMWMPYDKYATIFLISVGFTYPGYR